jgi:hypothetical protein
MIADIKRIFSIENPTSQDPQHSRLYTWLLSEAPFTHPSTRALGDDTSQPPNDHRRLNSSIPSSSRR